VAADRVKQWLGLLRLDQYFPALAAQGYDSLAILREAEPDEVRALVDVVGMPRGHAKVFVRGLLQLVQMRGPEMVLA